MGGLFAYLAAEATTAIRRKAITYALLAFGGLIGIFSGGYALNAVYTMLMFRTGPIVASLVIAGALFSLALISFASALVISKRRYSSESVSDRASPYGNAPYRAPYSQQRLIALAAVLAGAGTTAAALLKFKGLRNLLKARRFN